VALRKGGIGLPEQLDRHDVRNTRAVPKWSAVTDPRDARHARQLSDDAMWTIVCHPTTPAPALGARLGISNVRVNKIRHALKPAGWSCTVAYVPCAHCGALLTIGGHVRRDRAYHAPCRPAARTAIQATLDRRRWARADVDERNRLLDRRTASDEAHQPRTRDAATQHGARWTEEELAYLIAHHAEAEHRLATALGRSLSAVRKRLLRERGLL
jgi:hypothetical protein